jgi:hypothetical protein
MSYPPPILLLPSVASALQNAELLAYAYEREPGGGNSDYYNYFYGIDLPGQSIAALGQFSGGNSGGASAGLGGIAFAPIPEPNTALLVGIGLASLALRNRAR